MRVEDEIAVNDVGALPVAWYAVYTRHQHEKAVHHLLSSKGLETFLPLYTVARRWRDRTKTLTLPLFPCYVFLHGDLKRRMEVLMTRGVWSFVGTNNRPAAIPGEEITAIRRAVECSRQIEPHPFLSRGDRVRVISGPLAGMEGVLARRKNQFRLVLSVELMQKSAAVEIDAGCVERVSWRSRAELSKDRPGFDCAACR